MISTGRKKGEKCIEKRAFPLPFNWNGNRYVALGEESMNK